MSSTELVPETRLMAADQLSADGAWHSLRRLGADEGGKVAADTVLARTPGQSESVVQDLLIDSEKFSDAFGQTSRAAGLTGRRCCG